MNAREKAEIIVAALGWRTDCEESAIDVVERLLREIEVQEEEPKEENG